MGEPLAGNQMRYTTGYKYQLVDEYSVRVAVVPDEAIDTEFIALSTDGVLVVKRGYAWDGTKSFVRGSLVHDALYQLMHQGLLSIRWREEADLELGRISREDGMSRIRAWWVHRGLRRFGRKAASPESRRITYTAGPHGPGRPRP